MNFIPAFICSRRWLVLPFSAWCEEFSSAKMKHPTDNAASVASGSWTNYDALRFVDTL